MKLNIPKNCPNCGKNRVDKKDCSYDYSIYFECGTLIRIDNYNVYTIESSGKCSDKITINFGGKDDRRKKIHNPK